MATRKARKRLLRDSGDQVHPGNLLQPVQLRPAAPAPFALRRKPLPHDRGQPDAGRGFPAGCHLHRRPGTKFLEACDDWQFPLFLTLLLTGMRPGELVHLLLPDDLDLETGWLHIRNKPQLGWQVKTRNERDIPLVPVLVEVLRGVLGTRSSRPAIPSAALWERL